MKLFVLVIGGIVGGLIANDFIECNKRKKRIINNMKYSEVSNSGLEKFRCFCDYVFIMPIGIGLGIGIGTLCVK